MYQPPHFREERLNVLHALIDSHPLGLLVTLAGGDLVANPLPFLIDRDAGPNGTLLAHLARANGQWRDIDPSLPALVAFQGPQHYVTPSWYETKRETGKVVPTWNYATVQVRGPVIVHDDPVWLRTQVGRLTARHEDGRAAPWAVDDAPESFVAAQLKGIVGIEIPIAAIEGKWKVSQNRPAADRAGVVGGLGAEPGDAAAAMAGLVAARASDAR
ncbi:FMN-binding negative transcriptional regulator [Methyloraptor flagellatus]|uniref:FMN-binding negative transcriptional regulator n=1 Tax=Methyloraptor flagellatus TaxID=3162530 RepID=A0AAU7X9A9_9HYPH